MSEVSYKKNRVFLEDCPENCIFRKKFVNSISHGLDYYRKKFENSISHDLGCYCIKYLVFNRGFKTEECRNTPNSIDFITEKGL